MSRLTARLRKCTDTTAGALAAFITAGDPDLAVTEEIIPLLEAAGADVVELGIPFSDPMADGPTIQLSSERALSSGTTLRGVLQCVRNVRTRSEVPIVLMGYLNPVHAYGYEAFCRDAAECGVDGVLLVDMPPEESCEFLEHSRNYGLDVIFLLTPTSDTSRIEAVNMLGSGFVYYVTVTGVTGARASISKTLEQELSTVRRAVTLPVLAGFGISTPAQATEVGRLANGVVVGSALVRLFEENSGAPLKRKLCALVADLKKAL